jgi:hypothetical protein
MYRTVCIIPRTTYKRVQKFLVHINCVTTMKTNGYDTNGESKVDSDDKLNEFS